jgi:hypothetical protein
MDTLGSPIVLRLDPPALGVPVLSVDYRHQIGDDTPLAAVLDLLVYQQQQIRDLTAAVAYFDLSWSVRFWRSLRGRSRAAQRRRAARLTSLSKES